MFGKRKLKKQIPIKDVGLPGSLARRRKKRIILSIVIAVAVLIISYIGYLIASGKRVFDPASLTGSAFFKTEKDYQLKGEGDGRINVLLLGMGGASHPGGQLTDTIMVLSIDPKEKTMAMLSIPRDLWVPIPGTKNYEKINQIYFSGEEKKKGDGPIFAKDTIGKIIDLPIHYYVTVDFYAFKKIMDEIGGIDVYVDKAINDPLYPADDMIHYSPFKIKAGQQHLDGATALKYARSRESTSDFDRAGRQQKVIGATKDKIFKLGFLSNPKKLLDMVNILGDHTRTDFSPKEVYALARLLGEMDSSKTVSKVLTNAADGELVSDMYNGMSILKPKAGNWEQIQRVAHELFTDPNLREESARLEVLNGSNTAGLGTKLGDTLKSYNYTISKIANAPEKYEKTVIYDYSNNNKKITLQFLKNRLGAEVVTKPSRGDGIDISVIIGNNYKGFSKDPT